MAEQKTLTGSLEMRYVPDEYTAQEKAEGASWPLGAGYWDLGFVSEGAFFVLRRIHGGEVDKWLRLAKEQRDEQAQQAQAASAASEPTTPQAPPPAPATPQPPPPANEPATT